VREALSLHKDVQYLFDIHKDAEGRGKTTVTYKNIDYAQVYFVVRTNNPNWKQNFKFAGQLQELLNARIPNISKGIYRKDKSSGNGEYNQSVSGSIALIEIGGVENTLEESYRTIDVLAEVIEQLWSNEEHSALLAANL
jgi:stage II sporulation protein P